MTAGAVAGGMRRSWKPVSRIVVWQLQRSTTMSGGMRGMSTIVASRTTTTTTTTTSWLTSVAIENSFLRSAGVIQGEKWRSSSSWISSPHVRFASGTSSAAAEEDKEGEQQAEKKQTEAEWLEANNLEKSNYWGVTTGKSLTREDGTQWPWHCFQPADTYRPDIKIDLHKHREPSRFEERFAWWVVQVVKKPTVWFYQKRYGCRAMMLETVAAVPGMVGGMLLHLRSLRRFEQTGGWVRVLLDEAENERMHLMSLLEIVKPNWYERLLVVAVQGVFFNFYFLLYILSPRLAHRVTGYLEEEAIISYTTFLEGIDDGTVENVPAPAIAIDYWRLPKDAKLREMIVALRADEAHHRDVNHYAADIRNEGKQLHEAPAPVDYH
ncbi:unnamed protein product [Calypogeia fissa]